MRLYAAGYPPLKRVGYFRFSLREYVLREHLVIDPDAVEAAGGGGVGIANFDSGAIAVGGEEGVPDGRHVGGEFDAVHFASDTVPGDFAGVADVLDLDVEERDIDVDDIVVIEVAGEEGPFAESGMNGN